MTAPAFAITLGCTFVVRCSIAGAAPFAGALSKESQDVVRLGMGLAATMTALLLGLVTPPLGC
jgi:hypothetical protein